MGKDLHKIPLKIGKVVCVCVCVCVCVHHQPVVLPHEEDVERGEEGLLVDPQVAGDKVLPVVDVFGRPGDWRRFECLLFIILLLLIFIITIIIIIVVFLIVVVVIVIIIVIIITIIFIIIITMRLLLITLFLFSN